eukprot:TRINITY_DN11648_c1_g1_i1.p1 TRINITY_DN11648_c1_g1~~TRINITY_DN11648_c1_g1_i1.p1  ORF type:complete len:235 (+),score=31.99 TRINITY_DN11648_c1_g1_i1:198-902(+)
MRWDSAPRHLLRLRRRRRFSASASRMLIPPFATALPDSYHVVLDLDETLIHSPSLPPTANLLGRDVMKFKCGDSGVTTFVRPRARELVRASAEVAEALVWTAGIPEYAQNIVGELDNEWQWGRGRRRRVKHLVARDHRWFPSTGPYWKDLRRLGRELDRTLLIDNSPGIVAEGQGSNVVIVPDYWGQYHDDCLARAAAVVTDLAASGLPVPVFLQRAQAAGRLGKHPNGAFTLL